MFAKTFRNTLVASGVLVGASFIAGPAVLATSVSDNDTVTATVAEVNAVDFAGATTAFASGSSVPAFVMGSLNLQNNAAAGWTLDVSSQNGGRLINTATPAHVITYTALTTGAIGASTATAVTPTVATPSGQLHTSSYDAAVAAAVTSIPVTANIAAGQFVPVGSYTDILTFTLTSK